MEAKRFKEAYALACVGTSDLDWKEIGIQCLFHKELQTAKKCFMKAKDVKLLDLIDRLESLKRNGSECAESYFPEIYCYLVYPEDRT